MKTSRKRLGARRGSVWFVGAAVSGGMLTGCYVSSATEDVPPCSSVVAPEQVDEVDLLFVIDNSASMAEEQAQLAAELARLVGTLASGDRDGDGVEDFTPVRSLHIGVVSSDMGTGGYRTVTCGGGDGGHDFGDDSVLLSRAAAGCSGTYPAFFEFAGGVDDPSTFAQDVACVALAGTNGCGFEQQLEAALKAVSPASPESWTAPGYVPPVFHGSTTGHGGAGGANAGFVRPNSVLAIVVITDEDDCSVSDPEIYDMQSERYREVPLNLRCSTFAEDALHSVARYVGGVDGHGGLLGLRRDPSRLVFAGIAGVPTDVVAANPLDYDAILADARMAEVPDGTMAHLQPSCVTPGVGTAMPPRRIVEVARGIEAAGGRATIQSICQDDYSGVLTAVVDRVADALVPGCRQEG